MPTAFVAAKPVPATVTEASGAWAVGVSVMAAVAALMIGMTTITIESIRKAIANLAYPLFLGCILFISLVSPTTAITCKCI
jgi:hypothetical protein